MADLSERIQLGIVALVTCLHASRQEDALVRESADVLCQHLRNKISGRRPSTVYFRAVTKLGQKITENGISLLDGVDETEIMQKYDAE